MPNSATPTTMAAARAASPEIQARTFSPPSRMNSTARGSMAHRAVRNSEPPTASLSCWNWSNMGSTPFAVAGLCRDQGVSGQPAERGVEDLDGVGHPHRVAGPFDRRGDLHQASRVGGHQHLRAGRHDVGRLAVAELAGRPWVENVVDAGGAAAQLRLGDLLELQPGDGIEQLARLGPDALGVCQMARVVVGDGQLERVPRRDGAELDQDLRDVADL